MSVIKNKVLQEIALIPEHKLSDLYHFVHQFRLRVEKAPNTKSKSIMSFAGCWNDLPSQVFDEFSTEIKERRQNAFKRRRSNEGSIN